MRQNRVVFLFWLSVLACVNTACGLSYTMQKPDRFAHFHRNRTMLDYISAEGLRLQAWTVENEPKGNAEMWMRIVDLSLTDAGYHRLVNKNISGANIDDGIYAEYAYHFHAEDHRYSVALFTDDTRIYVVESGGTKTDFEKHRAAILTAISTFTVR